MDSPEPYPEERMEEWKWDGKGFVLAHATSTGMCRLIEPGGAWDLPTRVGLGGGSEGEAFFGLVWWGVERFLRSQEFIGYRWIRIEISCARRK